MKKRYIKICEYLKALLRVNLVVLNAYTRKEVKNQ